MSILAPNCFHKDSFIVAFMYISLLNFLARLLLGRLMFAGLQLVAHNGLRVVSVGDFGALHCQLAQKFDRSTQFQLRTSTPIEATHCYAFALLSSFQTVIELRFWSKRAGSSFFSAMNGIPNVFAE